MKKNLVFFSSYCFADERFVGCLAEKVVEIFLFSTLTSVIRCTTTNKYVDKMMMTLKLLTDMMVWSGYHSQLIVMNEECGKIDCSSYNLSFTIVNTFLFTSGIQIKTNIDNCNKHVHNTRTVAVDCMIIQILMTRFVMQCILDVIISLHTILWMLVWFGALCLTIYEAYIFRNCKSTAMCMLDLKLI